MAFIRPSFIDNMGYHMGEVYGAITDQILINLARYFPYWTESTVPKSAFEYQAVMLAQMGQVNAETVQILRNGLKGGNAALKNILEQAIMESVKKSFPELLKGVQNGIFNPATIPVLAPNQMQAFQFYYQQAAQKLNLVNTVMLESTRQAYQNTVADIVTRVQASQVALDVGAGEVVTGVSSWNQAMIHSINRMKENGITGFIDHAGHRWSAEAYTSMDIRTTVANTARAAVWETNQSFGNDLYLVSFHNGARPLCYPWQNKVISANDNAGVTYDLDGNEIIVIRQSDTSYGEPAGLFGINCRHYPTPFIPGVSVIYGQPQDKEENDRVYAESQQQRALERKIREEKRDLLMMKAQGNVPDEVIKAQRAKIRQTDDDIDAFCEKTGRARRQNREGVYTKREFPDPQTYDVTTFERTQKDLVDKYFENGGVQQNYTFGEIDRETGKREQKSFDQIFKEYSEKQRSNTTQQGEIDYDKEIARLEKEKEEYLRTHNRFERDPEIMRQMQEKITNLEVEKLEKQQNERLTQRASQEQQINANNANVSEEEVRKKAIQEYDEKISEIERKRFALIESGSDDWQTSDKLYQEIERLEDKKRIIENGGWTIEQATVTKSSFTVNPGSSSQIYLDKANIYTMPDGKQFVFKANMNTAHQTLTPDDLITKYYSTPKELRDKAQNTICVIDRYNPADAYWRKTYKNFSHSYMTGGDVITIYRHDSPHDLDYLLDSLNHEQGHGIDKLFGDGFDWFSEKSEWGDAMTKDKDFSGGVADSVSTYGKNSVKEDFAESVMKFVASQSGFKAAFPNRASILERLIFGGGT